MMFFWKIGPSFNRNPSPETLACSSSQMRSSGQLSTESFGSHWKYIRWISGERVLTRAKPRGLWA